MDWWLQALNSLFIPKAGTAGGQAIIEIPTPATIPRIQGPGARRVMWSQCHTAFLMSLLWLPTWGPVPCAIFQEDGLLNCMAYEREIMENHPTSILRDTLRKKNQGLFSLHYIQAASKWTNTRQNDEARESQYTEYKWDLYVAWVTPANLLPTRLFGLLSLLDKDLISSHLDGNHETCRKETFHYSTWKTWPQSCNSSAQLISTNVSTAARQGSLSWQAT